MKRNTPPGAGRAGEWKPSTIQQVAKNKWFTFGLNRINVTSVDGSASLVVVTLTVGHGKLFLRSTTGLTFLGGTANGRARVKFQGTVASVRWALSRLHYVPTHNFVGTDKLTIRSENPLNLTLFDQDQVSLRVS